MPQRPQQRHRAVVLAFRERIEDSYFAIPLGCVILAAGLAFGLVEADRSLQRASVFFAFTGGPQSARSILSAIASSMITFTGLVFSITVVALQLTSSQFSPRALRNFLRDRVNQLSLGIFLATFVFALLALRAVRGGSGETGATFIPGVTISFAVALVGLSVVMFIVYIHHMVQSMRVSHLLVRIAADAREALSSVVDADDGESPVDVEPAGIDATPLGVPHRCIPAPSGGVVTAVDVAKLVDVASRAEVIVHVTVRTGDFVPGGGPLLLVWGVSTDCDTKLVRCVSLASERSVDRDAGFGFRQLVDIAERALSPSVNDPTTAVQCLNQLHDLLRSIADRPFRDGKWLDTDDHVRVVTPMWTWGALVHLACDEIRDAGASSVSVQRRMRALLDDLLTVTTGSRRTVILEQLALLAARRSDLAAAERPLVDANLANHDASPADFGEADRPLPSNWPGARTRPS